MNVETTSNFDRNSMQHLLDIFNSKKKPSGWELSQHDALFSACQIVGKSALIRFNKPKIDPKNMDNLEYLQQIVSQTEVRVRKVRLERNWWQTDNGPLLSFYDGKPCALIPRTRGGYDIILSDNHRLQLITKQHPDKLSHDAYYFYRGFSKKIKGFKDIMKYNISIIWPDAKRTISMQALIALFGLFVPIITGFLFDTVVPNADFNLLTQLSIVLLANVFIITLFLTTQQIAIIRLRYKIQINTQPAIWDRLLRLPVSFFQRYYAGDLAMRATTFSHIQEELSASATTTIVTGLFSIITLGLMFYYSYQLAAVSALLAILITAINTIINFLRLKAERRMFHHAGKLYGIVLQFLTGLMKLKVAHAQQRVFTLWSERFARKCKSEMRLNRFLISTHVFIAGTAIFNLFILYLFVVLLGEKLSFGDFIIFNAAFTLFFSSIMKTAETISKILEIIPLYERASPIFTAKTEQYIEKSDPGVLSGKISIKNVAYRYEHTEKLILKDFSLEIESGQFIALVGSSGAGKTTLFRLLLGFSKPEAGTILYDDMNIELLNIQKVREQIGVVMQNSQLIPGTILDNITGQSLHLTRKDAFEIAACVGIDEMIRELPMGMDTPIIESMQTLSGGEAQRLMLARALAKKPRVLFLDEATSALDNTTQLLVHKYLRELHATQIVAAHRLSTIIHADLIVVIDNGVIIEQGSYETLLAKQGAFASLAKRQLS